MPEQSQAGASAGQNAARREEQTLIKQKAAAAGKIMAAHARRVVLMEWLMPNGKALGDCTGAECARMGGWHRAIAKRVAPRQIVRKVLSEDDVQALWKAATQ
jgi:hypothetical protein